MDSFVFYCNGHPNIHATHKTTLEFTKDESLTPRGDCILGVNSSCNLINFPLELKERIKSPEARILVHLQVGRYTDTIEGCGDSRLELSDEHVIIIRKSEFICSRTLMIKSDKAARDVNDKIIKSMKDPSSKMKITIKIKEQ
ncbi:MAG: DUF371 domain-containing protein [Candidatus Heimdallarchaeota archaeon]|nr:DUF371 domain-containing protein [Candidatus Heimdallarchaeota archaeon]MCK4876373.1 DUF371 domain-containing protein [Candidatus Heimdallarchaeota archaeon]